MICLFAGDLAVQLQRYRPAALWQRRCRCLVIVWSLLRMPFPPQT